MEKNLIYIYYIYINESFCCTLETSTTLLINYTSVKKCFLSRGEEHVQKQKGYSGNGKSLMWQRHNLEQAGQGDTTLDCDPLPPGHQGFLFSP